jgi:hypothetical protein
MKREDNGYDGLLWPLKSDGEGSEYILFLSGPIYEERHGEKNRLDR